MASENRAPLESLAGASVQSVIQPVEGTPLTRCCLTPGSDSSLPTYTGTLATGGTTSRPLEPARIPTLITATDFTDYRANERAPLVGQAFGHTIHTHAPPSFGGAVILGSLALLERKKLSSMTHPWLGPEFLYAVSEASRIANADRSTVVGDPAYSNVDARLAAMLGKDHLDARAALINGTSIRFGASRCPDSFCTNVNNCFAHLARHNRATIAASHVEGVAHHARRENASMAFILLAERPRPLRLVGVLVMASHLQQRKRLAQCVLAFWVAHALNNQSCVAPANTSQTGKVCVVQVSIIHMTITPA